MVYELPAHEDVVTRSLLERNAKRWPQDEFVAFEDGFAWTFDEALANAYQSAHALRQAGVGQGDSVAVLLGNGSDFLKAWWGIAALGAVMAPIHMAAKGDFLAHLLNTIKPVALIAQRAEIDLVVQLEDRAFAPPILIVPDELEGNSTESPELSRPVHLWDTALLLPTSGTTGPSKVVSCSYLQMHLGGSHPTSEQGRSKGESFLIDLPLFHGGALYMATGCLSTGIRMIVRSRADLNNYWEVARDTGASMSFLLGSMVSFLMNQPRRTAEAQHRLSAVLSQPLPADASSFQERFGIDVIHTAWGMTEVPGATVKAPGDQLSGGYIGRVREGYEVRLVDENDVRVEHGKPGELIVRADQPWMVATEYVGNPEATAEAWRNGWFHSGDLAREVDGQFYFVGRVKDALRRRGENVSAFEVEAAALQYGGVERAAVVGVFDPETKEDEVKIWIVASEDVEIDPGQVLVFLVDKLPYYMVPRYFEVVDSLPITLTQKVMKHELRKLGNSKRTWDREAHGYRLTRTGLERVEVG